MVPPAVFAPPLEGQVYSKSGRDPDFPPLAAAFGKKGARAQWLRDHRQWERYQETLGNQIQKTFRTFQAHKRVGDEKYQAWRAAIARRNCLKNTARYHKDGTVVATDIWKELKA